MKIDKVFPSNYLKASDFEEDTTLTIRDVQLETVGQGKEAEEKAVVFFEGKDKGLLLNKTNASTIAGLHGPDTDDWLGKAITLYCTEVEFKGEIVMGVRVRLRAPKSAPRQPAAAPAAAPAAGEPAKPAATAAIAKRKAWAAFKASALPGTSDEAVTEEWHTAIEGFRPGVPEQDWTSDDWKAFVVAEFQTTPF